MNEHLSNACRDWLLGRNDWQLRVSRTAAEEKQLACLHVPLRHGSLICSDCGIDITELNKLACRNRYIIRRSRDGSLNCTADTDFYGFFPIGPDGPVRYVG